MAKHGTPLRYPGGKQKLTPFIREIISANGLEKGDYAEPYAGGAGVAIELLLSGDVSKIHLNDSCKKIYSIWWAILRETEEFCRRIRNASLNVEEWKRQRATLQSKGDVTKLDLGFSAFYLNRVNRSGILSGGLIGGLSQEGTWKMDARFPRNELIRRIELIASSAKRIAIRNWDAERFVLEYVPRLPEKTLIYFDPPYFRKADRLYLNHYGPNDHARIAKIIQDSVKQPWLVSYDSVAEIRDLYARRKSFTYLLRYNAARNYEGSEFFAYSDKVKMPTVSSLGFIQDGLSRVADS